jgi:hypothetical protein
MTKKLLALSLLAACATEGDLTTAEQRIEGRNYLLPEVGTGQSRVVMNSFGRLSVILTDSDNMPLEGVQVTFTAPATGASALFVGGNIATTDESGRATITPWASTVKGTYTVWASVENADPMPFVLTNTPAAPGLVTVVLGADQVQSIGTPFADPLTVEVWDRYGNAVEGAEVEFVAPTSGPSTKIPDGTTVTDEDGHAAAFAFAGDRPGSYVVQAKVDGIPTVSFTLTNAEPGDWRTKLNGSFVHANHALEATP